MRTRTRSLCTLLVLVLAPLGAACKYNKETVPLTRSEAAIRVPNQQRIVSLAVEQAVEGLDFEELEGKSVSIEITGVFPHFDFDLLDYLRAQLVTRLTRQGVRVVNPIPAILLPGQAEAAPATGDAMLNLIDVAGAGLRVPAGTARGGSSSGVQPAGVFAVSYNPTMFRQGGVMGFRCARPLPRTDGGAP